MSENTLVERVEQLETDNARLRHLLARQGVGAELRHQVRNTLATVRAVVRRSAEIDGMVEGYAAHLDGRLNAILRVQSAITRGSIEGADLHSLVSSELLACLAQLSEQVRIEGCDVHLLPRAAEPLALAFHELTTNSIKFGALGVPEGRLDVVWCMVDGDGPSTTLEITWDERCGPAIEMQPRHRGFGTDVLERMLAYQLGARTDLSFEPHGLRCRIALPLSPDVGCQLLTPRRPGDE